MAGWGGGGERGPSPLGRPPRGAARRGVPRGAAAAAAAWGAGGGGGGGWGGRGAELRAARAACFPGAGAALPAPPSVPCPERGTLCTSARWPFSDFISSGSARPACGLLAVRCAVALAPPRRAGGARRLRAGRWEAGLPIGQRRRRGLRADLDSAGGWSLATRAPGLPEGTRCAWPGVTRTAPTSPAAPPPGLRRLKSSLSSQEEPACAQIRVPTVGAERVSEFKSCKSSPVPRLVT